DRALVSIAAQARVHAKSDDMVSAEAGILAPEVNQRAYEQASRYQQQYREEHLRRHQRPPQQRPRPGCLTPLLEPIYKVRPRAPQSWKQPEQEGSSGADCERERHDSQIGRSPQEQVTVSPGDELEQESVKPHGQQQARRPTQ